MNSVPTSIDRNAFYWREIVNSGGTTRGTPSYINEGLAGRFNLLFMVHLCTIYLFVILLIKL